jgi:4-hydroxy-3-methylbut-2-enyl diphosphate reductase
MEIVVGKMAGFCGGVRNAVDKTYEEAKKVNGTIYCLGDLVHNPVVLKNLEKLGVKIINNLEEIEKPNGKTVIVRAHGIAKEIYEQAESLNITLKDLTCPKVLKIHCFAEEHAKNDDYILLVGERKHPEVIGTKSFCGENSIVIENEEELKEALEKIKTKLNENKNISKNNSNTSSQKLALIAQTTFNLEKFKKFENIIANELEDYIDIVVNNTICDATRLRQDETENLSKTVDGMIIIGGRKSSNTNKLYQISLANCKNTIMVEDETELENELSKFKNCNKIGIMAGASTPKETIDKVLEIIEKI